MVPGAAAFAAGAGAQSREAAPNTDGEGKEPVVRNTTPQEDVDMIYDMLDEDRSGAVSYKEFIEQIHKIKYAILSRDDHTLLVFIKGFLRKMEFDVLIFMICF